ncbi:MAG: hypothetical protein VX607_00115, partial [Planctomycetota bacterium]|nr:hypothetical protein [Planctomycetota bacterium]
YYWEWFGQHLKLWGLRSARSTPLMGLRFQGRSQTSRASSGRDHGVWSILTTLPWHGGAVVSV